MRRTTISLPEDLAQDIEREAQQRRVSLSEVARDALREHLDRRMAGGLPFIGIGHSGTSDTARRAEEILAHEIPRACCASAISWNALQNR